MREFALHTSKPLIFSACGQLLSKGGFLHHRRCFEQNVLILVKEGTLYITSNGQAYSVGPNQYVFLKAGEEHFGHQVTVGKLSYLWVHFRADNDFTSLSATDAVLSSDNIPGNYTCLFPELGQSTGSKRLPVLFHQLLGLSLEKHPDTTAILDYSITLLMLELTREYRSLHTRSKDPMPAVILQICDWIKTNYYQTFTVADLADRFGYQADYLSSLFKRHLGISLTQYTNKIRIETAKNLLVNYDLTIKEAAYSCGFPDEKYFMKVFKKWEGITPTQYKMNWLDTPR